MTSDQPSVEKCPICDGEKRRPKHRGNGTASGHGSVWHNRTDYCNITPPCRPCGSAFHVTSDSQINTIREERDDVVNHPAHYTQGGIECIDAIKAAMPPDAFAGYLQGNAIKYLWRYRHKGGKQDLEKARWYINRLLEEV